MNKLSKLVSLAVILIAMPLAVISCNVGNGGVGNDKSDEATNGNGNNTENDDFIQLAENAYAEYASEHEVIPSDFMVYKIDGKVIALDHGKGIGVYTSSEAAVAALLGEDISPYYDLLATSVSGLFYCAARESYCYPLDTLPTPTAAIESDGVGLYVANGKRCASLIPLDGLNYEQVTIKNGSKNGTSNPNFAYTFLAEEPVLGQKPVYAKGYSYVIEVEPVQSLTFNIPEDAEYLYIYHHTENGNYYFPDEVIFSRKAEPENSFTLATWNTGNFSGGGKYTTIIDAQLEEKQKQYTDFIENRLNADLICLNEFDPNFTTSGNYATKDVLFSDYVDYVGVKYGYQCNSMFADQSLDMTVPHAKSDKRGYGYYATEITVGGKTVTVVSVHLNYDHNYVKGTTDEVNKAQILDLLAEFADKDHIIFLGDWNCIQFEQYDLLTDAGYILANNDPDLWTKAGGAINNRSLDNIAYKGVTISNFTCEITNLSDHYALTCTVSVD